MLVKIACQSSSAVSSNVPSQQVSNWMCSRYRLSGNHRVGNWKYNDIQSIQKFHNNHLLLYTYAAHVAANRRCDLCLCKNIYTSIKWNQIYLQAQNIRENAGDKQKVINKKLNKSEQQVQTWVQCIAGLKGRETALTWAHQRIQKM